ncbi:MAG: right-handed parallel beta-helix repeat-containing protein [Verrucomicrobiia bacterium]|jgi:parallel beta-helix repeat protein
MNFTKINVYPNLFLITICSALSIYAQTNVVPSRISSDVTLSGTNLISGNVIVETNATLTIEAGTTMLMNTAAVITVYGRLLAMGTTNQPIYFTRATTSARWNRIMFIKARPSSFNYCYFEYANSTGSHLDYYDNDCNPDTPPPNRSYHEAIVAIATHLDFYGCLFRYLPDTSSSAEGDAIAIISDDPQVPGAASATIRECQFLSIGQCIHTRYSYVLVERCYFTGKRGDNDYVDLYGESNPPPLILNNVFAGGHDDAINPTRCSAILIGNIVYGTDDHGIVLRDKCYPVLINNLIYNCPNGGIAVQNQCDALIINNTIANCNRGIRFFDHTQRWGPPYCLNPGSGKATIINTIIWDCATSLELQDSPYTEDRGSHATLISCNIKGGTTNVSLSANSTLTWLGGNINANPIFTNNYRLQLGSPCIDSGTNVALFLTNLNIAITNDYDSIPRPLDGNNDGVAQYDIGAFEFLNPIADSNKDGIPDGWCYSYGLNPILPDIAETDPDNDNFTNLQEYIADTNPTDPLSFLKITAIETTPDVKIHFTSSSNRIYTLYQRTNFIRLSEDWFPVPGLSNIRGKGRPDFFNDTNIFSGQMKFYKIGVGIP